MSWIASTIVTPFSRLETMDQVEDFDLVADIEIGGRLVQEQDLRLLGKGGRDPGALALAAGQLPQAPVGEVGRSGAVQRPADGVLVVRGIAAEQSDMREPSLPNQLPDAHLVGRGGLLGEKRRDVWRSHGAASTPIGLPSISACPALGLISPASALQGGALARAVRPDQRADLAPRPRDRSKSLRALRRP